jgi:hypothetical protein
MTKMKQYLCFLLKLVFLLVLSSTYIHAQAPVGTPCTETRGDSTDFRNKLIDRFLSANDAFFYTIIETKPTDAIRETGYLNQRLNTKLFNKAECIDFRNFKMVHVFIKDSVTHKLDSMRLQLCFVKVNFSKSEIPRIRNAMKKFGHRKYFKSEMSIQFSWLIKDQTLYLVFTETPFSKWIGSYMDDLNMGDWE